MPCKPYGNSWYLHAARWWLHWIVHYLTGKLHESTPPAHDLLIIIQSGAFVFAVSTYWSFQNTPARRSWWIVSRLPCSVARMAMAWHEVLHQKSGSQQFQTGIQLVCLSYLINTSVTVTMDTTCPKQKQQTNFWRVNSLWKWDQLWIWCCSNCC